MILTVHAPERNECCYRLAGLTPDTGSAQQDKAVYVQEDDVDSQRTNCFSNVREDSGDTEQGRHAATTTEKGIQVRIQQACARLAQTIERERS